VRWIVFLITFLFANPITPIPKDIKYNKEKALLGKKLYLDPILSRDKRVSCNSCHRLDKYGVDNLQFSIGAFGRIDTPMNSPTTFNAVFNCCFFWNGRAKNLIIQAQMANQAHKEMDMTPKLLEERINKIPYYKNAFKKIYKTDYITYDMIFDAIAEFEKALITPDSKFDRFLRKETNLTKKELRGYILFKSYGCITCHNGVNLGGNSFQKIGVFFDAKISRGADRYEVTKDPNDKYVYRVPPLRNILKTYPYFHDGSVKDIKEAIEKMGYYNLGIEIPQKDIDDIVEFFKTLTGKKPKILEE